MIEEDQSYLMQHSTLHKNPQLNLRLRLRLRLRHRHTCKKSISSHSKPKDHFSCLSSTVIALTKHSFATAERRRGSVRLCLCPYVGISMYVYMLYVYVYMFRKG